VVEHGYGLAARIAAGAPLVNRWHKKFIRRMYDRAPLSEAEREETHEAFATQDYREGRKAFLEKRDPRFSGE
jgi:enoyl-CoA hydratase/carnithine racemase